MEEIRKTFISKFHLTGNIKIAYFDPKYVYLEFDNDVDHNNVFNKEYVDIESSPMKFFK